MGELYREGDTISLDSSSHGACFERAREKSVSNIERSKR